MTIRNLTALLRPMSVVLIGASPNQDSVGGLLYRNVRRAGYKGKLWLVNPHHSTIEGERCYRTVADLPEVPNLAIIATPARTVPGLVRELSEKGTRAAVVLSAGMTAEMKAEMLNNARPNTLRIQGPNCLGLMLPGQNLDASFSHRSPLKGDLAFLSQSGALITSIVDWASSRNIGFSHVLSLGDMADVDFGDVLDYLAADIESRAILLYMEAVTDAPKFLSAARRAARAKPVVVIKSGRHSAGAKAARSHTGALAGSDAAYEAAFRRAGVLRVRELEQLFDAAEILSRAPRLSGERLTILTNGGGAGVLATDRLADWQGVLAPLSDQLRNELDGVLPPTWSHANPVDIIGDATPERYGKSLDFILKDSSTDAILILNCPTALSDSTRAASTVVSTVAAHRKERAGKPVLTVWLGDEAAREGRTLFRSAGIPTFDSPDDAVNGFMQLVRYRRAQAELMQTPPSLPNRLDFDVEGARQLLARALERGDDFLSEADSKKLLTTYGIPIVQTKIARTPEEAGTIAEELIGQTGGIALKIFSHDITHKTDVGGVKLNLESAAEVVDAARAMLTRVKAIEPNARIEGFTVQPMIRRNNALELIAGMHVDETFGPIILFGRGGIAVEVLRDTAQALPPLDLRLASELIRQTRASKLLAGYRDRPPADINAIALTLVRLSYLISEHPEIRELDINPLLADEKGVIALDARVRIADPALKPRVPMAIRPYPSQWETSMSLKDGLEVLVRPIRPDDEHLYEKFFQNVTPHDMRMRFFMAARTLSHTAIARLTQIDYRREVAFVAIDKATGDLLGVVRFVADPDYVSGEYAVLLASRMKGKGLGWRLMQHLIAYASAEGLQQLTGSVLAENKTMLRMCNQLGFSISEDPMDHAIRIVTLPLTSAERVRAEA